MISKQMNAFVVSAKGLEKTIALLQKLIDFHEDAYNQLNDRELPRGNNKYSRKAEYLSNTAEFLRELKEIDEKKLQKRMQYIQKGGGMDYFESWSNVDSDGLPPIESYAEMSEIEEEVERALHDYR